jgi:hypothetical protein
MNGIFSIIPLDLSIFTNSVISIALMELNEHSQLKDSLSENGGILIFLSK